VESDEPSTLCMMILNLTSVVSTWLTAGNTDISARVICEQDPNVSAARLALVRVVRANIAESLRLLGLQAPPRM
jgi:arginyl-tRNA synthetase